MFRNAQLSDKSFILGLVTSEAANGHFPKELAVPAKARPFALDLDGILLLRRRNDGGTCYALIWETDAEPVGFVLVSGTTAHGGNELWMAGIAADKRARGEGTAMMQALADAMTKARSNLLARCPAQSQVMYQVLLKAGFKLISSGNDGPWILKFPG